VKKLAAIALGLALASTACSGEGAAEPTAETSISPTASAETIVIRASSDLAVGTERLLVAFASPSGDRLGSPTQPVSMEIFPQDAPSDVQSVEGTFIWAIPEVSGLYRATIEFDRPGTWIAVPTLDGVELEAIGMTVSADSLTPAIGQAAPASDTPTTAGGVELADISTDPNPDPAFYGLSIAEAVSTGRPTVVVFATPAFCQTAICGPTLEELKSMRPQFPDVNFVHVEVYDLVASGDASSVEDLVVHPSVVEWGLPSEPWVFVVNAEGIVTGRFEGVVSQQEIDALL